MAGSVTSYTADSLKAQLAFFTQGTPAYFKQDGKRFLNSDCTVKLVSGGEYQLQVTFNARVSLTPGSGKVRLLSTGAGAPSDAAEPEDVEFADVTPGGAAAKHSVLHAPWTCGVDITGDSSRTYVYLDVNVEGFGGITMPLLLKAYHPDSPHIRNGSVLRYIEYDYRRDKDGRGGTQLGNTRHCN